MASLRDIKKRIKSAQNTRKLTKALKMISAIKLRRAQESLNKMKSYSDEIALMARSLSELAPESYSHKLLFDEEAIKNKKELLVVIGPDKAKCGPLINYLTKKVIAYTREQKHTVDVVTISKKLTETLVRTNLRLISKNNSENFPEKMVSANNIFKLIDENLSTGEYGKVSIAFTKFRSAISQVPTIEQIIPVTKNSFGSIAAQDSGFSQSTIFEPKADKILDYLIPESVKLRFLYGLLESSASEHGARMNAMENATTNAGEMISALKLTFNKLRQASITKELLEITAGVESMKG